MSIQSDKAAKLVKQVEFYFGDVNLAKDVFLKGKVAENAEGFVKTEVLMTFKRVQDIVGAIENAPKAVAEALAKSEKLIVDMEALSVRRKDPLPESVQTDAETVFVKPVAPTSTLEDLEKFFGEFGTVRAVWRRYEQSKAAKNSVFVVFSDVATVEKLVANPPTKDGEVLTIVSKVKYLADKAAEVAAKKEESKKPAQRTPPMPADASISITGCGKLDDFRAVKGLWGADLQSSIRYVTLADEKATIIFQDKQACDAMLEDIKTKGQTLNGAVPTVTRLEGEADKAATDAAEAEIASRASSGGRGGGRGGRGGRGGGRGGRGGKRPRD